MKNQNGRKKSAFLRRGLPLAAAVLLLGAPCAAHAQDASDAPEPASVYAEQFEASGADSLEESLPEQTRTVLRALQIDPSDPDSLAELDAGGVLRQTLGMISERAAAPMRACASVVGALLLCAAVRALGREREEALAGVFSFCTALAVGTLLLVPLTQAVRAAVEAVRSCGIFLAAFVPVFLGVLLASGRAATAAGFRTLVFGAAQAIIQLSSAVLAPFAGTYLGVSAAAALSQGVRLDGIAEGVKKAASWTLGLCMTLFLGILGVQTAVASASDSVGLKTARYFVGSFVPVIGSSLSEALGTVQSCLGLLRSTLGVYAVAAAALILLPSVLELLLWKLALCVGSAVCDLFAVSRVGGTLRAVGGALSLLLGVELCCGALCIVSVGMVAAGGGV